MWGDYPKGAEKGHGKYILYCRGLHGLTVISTLDSPSSLSLFPGAASILYDIPENP